MSNPYYTHAGAPAQGAAGSSASMRAELDAIQAGFALLPQFTSGYIVRVNVAASALEAITPAAALAAIGGIDAATVAATYQTQAGMSSYLTTANGLAKASNLSDVANVTTARGNLSAAASGLATSSGLTSNTAKILGRLTAATGAVEELDETLYARTNRAQTFAASQRGAYTTLTDAATIALDLSLGNFYKVQLGGNRTLGAATNVVAGQSGEIDVYQDGTGTRTLAYAWMYQFAGGTAPTLSTAKFAKDLLAFVVNFYKSMTVTAITNGANAVVTSVAHTMFSGQKVQFSALSGSTGLATATPYWVTVVDADTFKLSSSLANCVAGTYITTSSGFASGTLEAATITLSALQAVA